MFHVFTLRFFLNFVNRADRIWSSDNMWRQVKLKEKPNIIEFDLRKGSTTNHRETKKACISFKSIIFAKKHIFRNLSPIGKL